MSRSYRKTPILGYTASSDKQDKRRANRKFRKKSRLYLEDGPKKMREISDEWEFNKDGKRYIKDIEEKWIRK